MAEANLPVVVGLSGGLGNQMFQYAAGRSLSHKLACDLVMDLSWFQEGQDRKFALAPFNIFGSQRSACSLLPSLVQPLASRVCRRWATRLMGVPIFREPHFHFTPAFNAVQGPVFLEGYWQSERYFKEVSPLLLCDFALVEPMPPECRVLLEKIQACQSISVHVRRGDYLANPVAAKVHGTCSIDYYRLGVAELCRGLERPHCFVFSDDPEWVRASLSFDCPFTVVDVNGPDEAHRDLALMSACQHFLIANSSLSWWAAWLGRAVNKRVIAPAKWFLTSDKDTRDLIPPGWERL